MIKIRQYIPFHLAVVMVSGIVVSQWFLQTSMWITGLLALLALVIMFLSVKRANWKPGFQIATYTFVFLAVFWRVLLSEPANNPHHLIHFELNDTVHKTLTLETELTPGKYHHRFLARADYLNEQPVDGRLLVYIKQDSTLILPGVGQQIQTFNPIKIIPKPLNPGAFDYARYMQQKGVYHQINLNTQAFITTGKQVSPGLKARTMLWREHIQDKLAHYAFGTHELAVLNALILGDRRFISGDIRQDYVRAGAVHLLAVSGLHVGIIFMLLLALLKPLEYVKHGRVIRGLLIIMLLWGFALLTGLSGSVVRAVTMFSFISIGQFIRPRKSPVLHSLTTSFIVMLMVNPYWLYDVGFQLSYTAVLGIVLFQPLIEHLLPRSQYYLLRKTWQLATVSIAATLGTLPLSLYYFHQFPGLFLLSNVLIVPLMGTVLGLGLVAVFLAYSGYLPHLLVVVLNGILKGINSFMAWIAAQEKFLLTDISWSKPKVIATVMLLAAIYLWLSTRRKKLVILMLSGIILLQLIFIYDKWQALKHDELVVFHRTTQTLIGIKKGQQLDLFHSGNLKTPPRFVRDYSIQHMVNNTDTLPLNQNFLAYKNRLIMLIDSNSIYEPVNPKPEIVILTQSPQLHLERLIERLQPQLIIADGSNYKSMLKLWRETCQKKNVKFYATGIEGAFKLEL
ncbi:MAG: hypothetical protein CR968_06465 [Flavobacteriia bacterium]|nr:MAG: hypothetical protein CR968_06465 [Flavobacteriia bacterium]